MSTGTPRNAPVRLTIASTLAMLVLLLSSTLALAAQPPVKSPADDNDYRFIELDNGLRAILVSDSDADKAAASMNVAVGSGDDPAGREGLAHFLEHMLFLGTEKYPEPGEYQQFIKSHGGSHNAYTAFQDTNYFFDVEAPYLEPALDRFAEQFAAPLFTAELVDRERNAVHSEFSSKQKEDGRRFYSVKKAASNPEHAFNQFAVGNLSTLENTDENPLRPDLIQFWKDRYSANLMTLAVYGPQPLDALEQMVQSRFGAIENRQLEAKTHPAAFYQDDKLPGKVTADAIKDVRRLTLSFPIPSQEDNYHTKPASYIANLLGHEGPGSLFDVLKRAGLVESLSAGVGMDTGEGAMLDISMSLTPEGLRRQDDILPLVFAYIDKIRSNGITEQRFREMQQLARIDFRFREQGEPVHEAMALASQLQHYPAEDILSAPWLLERYAPEQYQTILDHLTPDNLMAFVLAPEPALKNPEQTRWYGAEWQWEALDPENLTRSSLPELAAQLKLPQPNPFVPEELAMVAGSTMEQPTLLGSQDGLEIWFARDTRFDTPKANVFISLRTPAARVSARSSVLTQLLVDAVNTNLNAWAYSARLAGLDYSIYPHLRGITVRVGGYSDKLHTLINRILMQVAEPDLTQQRFDIARQNLVDSLKNKAKNPPVEQTSEFIQTALIEGAWSTDDKLSASQQVTLDELKSFSKALLSEVDPVMLAHGNLSRAYALNLAQQIRAIVLDDSSFADVDRSRVRQLPPDETQVSLDVNHPDTGYTLYMQGDNTGFDERARFRLLAQIISSPFYENIRTTRQLGYIVYATPFEILETPALGFVIQSPGASPEQIDQAVRQFSADFEAQLASLDEAGLNREKQAVISKLLERDRQLGDISSRYWREIDRNATDFDSREQLANAVKGVSRQALLETFRKAVLDREQALRVVTGEDGLNADSALTHLMARPPVPAT
ncbi:insulinase family protein [Marinobacter sp. M216]|uniref:Protease 3 n=1 Tax=Marinobacter albus TaxID=3030833 RepID=A0ABT7HF04_9GAMM|nr:MULTISPECIES: insulinase family protein [unclassified Marinobacter]MBW7472403.1 insulinase family protein [Marinobacter sp. F4218]MDK9558953.1 insulinase family protein [Marinobacter sp. M216]